MAEPLSALGETGEEGSGGIEGPSLLCRSATSFGASDGLGFGPPRSDRGPEETAGVAGSVSAGESDWAEDRGHLRDGQPEAQPAGNPEESQAVRAENGNESAPRLWKRRSPGKLGNRSAIPTFPQPRRRASGYILNVSTCPAKVTFLNGLNRVSPLLQCVWQLNRFVDRKSAV